MVELAKIGDDLRTQFFDACNDDISAVSSLIRLAQLESKIERIQAIVDRLRLGYSKDIADLLKGLGIPHVVKEDTIENDLKVVVSHAKRYVLEIDLIKKKMQSKKSEPATRDMYENILVEIDPKLKASDIDVLRFAVLFNRLKEKARRNGARKDN